MVPILHVTSLVSRLIIFENLESTYCVANLSAVFAASSSDLGIMFGVTFVLYLFVSCLYRYFAGNSLILSCHKGLVFPHYFKT